mmetsp:Transcript_51462/g.116702  ORF Transcript_51462/g.116702 Transcript_51462/m.116702 type:complete len:430 (+) Transcript_51462:269-1558(+)
MGQADLLPRSIIRDPILRPEVLWCGEDGVVVEPCHWAQAQLAPELGLTSGMKEHLAPTLEPRSPVRLQCFQGQLRQRPHLRILSKGVLYTFRRREVFECDLTSGSDQLWRSILAHNGDKLSEHPAPWLSGKYCQHRTCALREHRCQDGVPLRLEGPMRNIIQGRTVADCQPHGLQSGGHGIATGTASARHLCWGAEGGRPPPPGGHYPGSSRCGRGRPRTQARFGLLHHERVELRRHLQAARLLVAVHKQGPTTGPSEAHYNVPCTTVSGDSIDERRIADAQCIANVLEEHRTMVAEPCPAIIAAEGRISAEEETDWHILRWLQSKVPDTPLPALLWPLIRGMRPRAASEDHCDSFGSHSDGRALPWGQATTKELQEAPQRGILASVDEQQLPRREESPEAVCDFLVVAEQPRAVKAERSRITYQGLVH